MKVVTPGRKEFGERLREARLRKGLDPHQVAARFNISHKTVYAWEGTGAGIPDALRLKALARLYECSVDDLLWGSESPDHPRNVAGVLSAQVVQRIVALDDTQRVGLERVIMAYIDAVTAPGPPQQTAAGM